MKLVEVITETLKEVSPENASYFEENKNSYETELKSLDDEFKDIVANGRHRMVVVADKFPFSTLPRNMVCLTEQHFPAAVQIQSQVQKPLLISLTV